MGWDIGYGQTVKELKAYLRAGAERNGYRNLAEASRGRVWYRAMEEVATGKKFIAVYLIRSGKGYAGYKPMDEDMHPFYYDCPLKLLEAAKREETGSVKEWRDNVRALAARK